jgi:hypothetical protein
MAGLYSYIDRSLKAPESVNHPNPRIVISHHPILLGLHLQVDK